MTGVPAAGGTARGIARVIATLAEAGRLRPGDVLVTRATDPAWTPLFPLVAAVVLEVGGQLSHGAIVAREYGVPAVVNVPGATTLIPDGQPIVVDGTAGRVTLAAP
jgi:pyruvate,water dikinase